MQIRRCLFFLVALLLLLPVTSQANTTAQEIITKVMQAYGGRGTVEKIHAVCAKGKIIALAFHTKGSYSYCVAKRRRLRVDINYKSFSERRILNGRRVAVYHAHGGLQVITRGANYRSVVYQYEQLSLPRALLRRAVHVHYAGREQHDGQPVEVLSLKTGDSPLIKIYVDAASGRIVQTSATILMGGGQMTLSSKFRDFRKVGNTIFPFTLINYAGSEKIAKTTIKDYELNPNFGGDTFRLPDSDAE